MKVYIVEYRQGRFDDVCTYIPAVFTSKALADNYIHKLQCVFKNCYDFYKSIYDDVDDDYEKFNCDDERQERLELSTKWCYYHDKIEKFETPYCFVIEKELIGIKKGES